MTLEGILMNNHDEKPALETPAARFPLRRERPLRVCMLLVLLIATVTGVPALAGDGSHWAPPAPPRSAEDLVDGRTVVQEAVDFMNGHKELAFEALVTYGAVQEDGQKIHFDMLQKLALSLPDRLYWTTLFDDGSTHQAWCNRGEFTLVKQPANVWGRITVPPVIADAVTRISTEYNLDVPFVDILSGDPTELWLGEDVLAVDYVGPAWIGGYWTDHVAIRKPGVDFELWFRQGDQPFPVKIELVYTDAPQLPSYSARFKAWSTDLAGGSIPEFTPPAEGEQVEVVPVVDVDEGRSK